MKEGGSLEHVNKLEQLFCFFVLEGIRHGSMDGGEAYRFIAEKPSLEHLLEQPIGVELLEIVIALSNACEDDWSARSKGD